jgi:hypothetical protein
LWFLRSHAENDVWSANFLTGKLSCFIPNKRRLCAPVHPKAEGRSQRPRPSNRPSTLSSS